MILIVNMRCKKCGKEFISIFSDICPFCGNDNSESLLHAIFSDTPANEKPKNKNKPFDPYDWDNPDNCSDREYMDDDDFDDFDN